MDYDKIQKGVSKGAKTIFKGLGIAATKVGSFFSEMSKNSEPPKPTEKQDASQETKKENKQD